MYLGLGIFLLCACAFGSNAFQLDTLFNDTVIAVHPETSYIRTGVFLEPTFEPTTEPSEAPAIAPTFSPTKDTVQNSLSKTEVAGIVIGSVLGAGAILGMMYVIYHFIYLKWF